VCAYGGGRGVCVKKTLENKRPPNGGGGGKSLKAKKRKGEKAN